jgi:hypothetical protein
MVQNEQQYIFIHQCLLYVLQNFYPSLISPSTFAHHISTGSSTFSAVPPTPLWSSSHSTPSGLQKAPRIEVHQNPAFMEDDEGIVESGL